MVVQHNLSAMNANRMYGLTSNFQAKATEKLSSGYRINRAADDAAGLAISEKLRRQIRGLNRGAENIQDGVSLCQVADGALAEVDDILHRANELAVQSANGTNTDTDREYIQQEVNQLVKEINRIGAETTFNEIHIFDKEEIEKQVGKITKLVSSPSADNNKMNESYLAPDGKYYPAASMDFSAVNSKNVDLLNGGEFHFVCPFGCKETFEIKLSTDEPSTLTGKNANTHKYTVNISGATTGADVVDKIYDYVLNNPSSGVDTTLSATVGGIGVSHASAFVKDGNKLTVLAAAPQSSEAAAKNYGSHLSGKDGEVNCSSLTNIFTPEPIYSFRIQGSSNVDDALYVRTRMMNGEVLTVDPLDVSTESAAGAAIDKIKYGMEYIAELRSSIGANQNQLEHAYNNNMNTAENTTAAESQIRDTDMAKMMVEYSNRNILAQAGQSMLAQANQSKQGVLSLLQ